MHASSVRISDRASTRALERRVLAESSLSSLARLALESLGSDELVEAVARSVGETLDAERAAVIDVVRDANGAAVMRAGRGWPAATPLVVPMEIGDDDLALMYAAAEVIEGDDAISVVPASWRLAGSSRAAVAVVRPDDCGSIMLIAALDAGHEAFGAEELAFLESAADVLAAALRRSGREERARYEAMHDALTGVANRALFNDRLQNAVARAARSGGTVAVLDLDLDRFAVVNETLGHDFGDELLVAVARRLSGVLGAEDTLARVSGDEFAILCEGSGGERGAIELAERVLGALEPPVVLDEREVFIAASVGLAVTTGRGADAESLLSDAQVAMYRAKEHGGGYELFDRAMRRRTFERLDLERDMRRALDRHEFELHYQPIVSLDEQQIAGLEALVRWRHPQRGLVPPGAFIPLAEESGLILPLGRWVLQEACRQLARWAADPEIEVPYVSVNLSGRQLAQPDLPEEIAELLRVTGVRPERLALELTESVLMEETDSPTAVLERLNGLGVRLMLDDFGTGYSSLNYIKRFPVEAIKIDRSFVSGVVEDESDRHIIRAIVSMAAGFDVEAGGRGGRDARPGTLAAPSRDHAGAGLRVRPAGARLGDRGAAARRAPARSPRRGVHDARPRRRRSPSPGTPPRLRGSRRCRSARRRTPSRSRRARCGGGRTPAVSRRCARSAVTAASPSARCSGWAPRSPRAASRSCACSRPRSSRCPTSARC